jgi:hypothetical protein
MQLFWCNSSSTTLYRFFLICYNNNIYYFAAHAATCVLRVMQGYSQVRQPEAAFVCGYGIRCDETVNIHIL